MSARYMVVAVDHDEPAAGYSYTVDANDAILAERTVLRHLARVNHCRVEEVPFTIVYVEDARTIRSELEASASCPTKEVR